LGDLFSKLLICQQQNKLEKFLQATQNEISGHLNINRIEEMSGTANNELTSGKFKEMRKKVSDYRINIEIEKDEFVCRICLSSSFSEEDPFISPCNCSGTMKFIHFN